MENAMTTIEITDTMLIVHVEGFDKILALKSQLQVPLSHVVDAEVDPQIEEEFRRLFVGIKAPGTGLAGVIRAGTWYTNEGKVFWDIHHPENAIMIHLADDTYDKLLIEVANPAASVGAIREAIQRRL